ncbi:MAG: flagellar hook-basal body complex protein [Oscillospiraceae bacterium]|nr:flagellar hook-basal body complex protein [Oscillospiraceae bacterium]
MIKSLYSGVTGLKSHNQRMDVIGNNIANVNTTAYKAGTVTFKDVYYQTRQRASSGDFVRGGVNPTQIGMGVQLGTVGKVMSQSGLTYSDSVFDMALEGSGFFQVMDQVGNIFYTRLGRFGLDDFGNLVDANGYMVLGVSGDPSGVIASQQRINIQIPDIPDQAASVRRDFTIGGQNYQISVTAAGYGPGGNIGLTINHANSPFATMSGTAGLNVLMDLTKDYEDIVRNDPTSEYYVPHPGATATVVQLAQYEQEVVASIGRAFSADLNEAIRIGGVNVDDALIPLSVEFGSVPDITAAQNADNYREVPGTATAATQWYLDFNSTQRNALSTYANALAALASSDPVKYTNLTTGLTDLHADASVTPTVPAPVPDTVMEAARRAYLALTTGADALTSLEANLIEQDLFVRITPAANWNTAWQDLTVTERAILNNFAGQLVNTVRDNAIAQGSITATQTDIATFYNALPVNLQAHAASIIANLDAQMLNLSIVDGSDPLYTPAFTSAFTGSFSTTTPTLNARSSLNIITRNAFAAGIPEIFNNPSASGATSVALEFLVTNPGANGNRYEVKMQSIAGSGNVSAQWNGNILEIKIPRDRPAGQEITAEEIQNAINRTTGNSANTPGVLAEDFGAYFQGEELNGLPVIIVRAISTPTDPSAPRQPLDMSAAIDFSSVTSDMPLRVGMSGGEDSFFQTAFKSLATLQLRNGTFEGPQTPDTAEIFIDRDGVIYGEHPIHGVLLLGRVDIVDFVNPEGLQQYGTSYFRESLASGTPTVRIPQTESETFVISGALEMSNVDLSNEFSDMIITQRGFQANSRIITVSDSMLEELVNLKR